MKRHSKICIALAIFPGLVACNAETGSVSQSALDGTILEQATPACLSVSASVVGLSGTTLQFSGNASVQGSVVLFENSTLTLSGNASVTDQAYLPSASDLTTNGPASVGSIVVQDLTDHEQAVLDFAQQLTTLTPTQEFGSLSDSQTIFGGGGLNVIQIDNGISLSGGSVLQLQGNSNDEFVLLVKSGGIHLSGNASITASENLSARKVMFVIEGSNSLVVTGNGSMVGTYVASNGSAQVSGNGSIVGAFVAYGSIQLSGNGLTFTPAAWCPEITIPSPSPSSSTEPSASPSPSPATSPSPSPSPSSSSSPSPSPSTSPSPSPSPSPTVSGGPGVLGV